jgi:hypothetical protein
MCREMQYDEFALELISEKFFQADLVNGIPLPMLLIDHLCWTALPKSSPQYFEIHISDCY